MEGDLAEIRDAAQKRNKKSKSGGDGGKRAVQMRINKWLGEEASGQYRDPVKEGW